MTFVLDSNIISFLLKNYILVRQNFIKTKNEKNIILIAPFAYYEVRRGLLSINATKLLKDFSAMCDVVKVGVLEDAILDMAIDIHVELKAKGWNIDEIDIFIAAFCKLNNYTLVTNNTKHFEQISGLRITDWSKN
jgi:tRNA(fMet)-specific endonuclease VapC